MVLCELARFWERFFRGSQERPAQPPKLLIKGATVKPIHPLLTALLASSALWAASAGAITNEDIAARIKPVGEVCIAGQECKGVEAVAASAGGGAAKTPESIVGTYCGTCHNIGLLDAPKVGDTAAWKKRADEQGGLDGLLAKAISGINSMPPKGTCMDCTEDELKGAIQHMSGL